MQQHAVAVARCMIRGGILYDKFYTEGESIIAGVHHQEYATHIVVVQPSDSVSRFDVAD